MGQERSLRSDGAGRGVVVVDSFAALLTTELRSGTNAVCFRRVLAGDFAAVARAFAPDEDGEDGEDGVVVIDDDDLAAVAVGDAGRAAVAVLRDDLRRLTALGRDPVLNCIRRYARDERGLPIRVDVHSFHADRAPVPVDTWLCTYAGAPSEGLDNDAAVRLVDVPDIRRALRAHHRSLGAGAGAADDDDDAFAAFLADESFDVHYGATDAGGVFSFGVGHLWRIAVDWPGSPVPPCLHRAPAPRDGDPPRLLLIC